MSDPELEQICSECGNDLVCEGYGLCSECLESVPTQYVPLSLVLLDESMWPEPSEEEKARLDRAFRNARPHCYSCGSFCSAKTLHYVHGDDLRVTCPRCGPDQHVT